MDKDLKRQQIDSTSISDAVDTIILPPGASTSASQSTEAPLALRLSGQLLLGLVKIFDRKVTYLKLDCDEALQKMVPLTKDDEGEDRGRHTTQLAAPHAKRTKKAATSHLPGHGKEGMGTDGIHLHFAVEDDEIFGGGSKTDPLPDSLKATAAGGSTSMAKVSSTMLAAPHASGSAAEIIGAPSKLSLNAGRTVMRDADDEMFDPVPEQFDFDLHDNEVSQAQVMKSLDTTSPSDPHAMLHLTFRSRSLLNQKDRFPCQEWTQAT